MTIIDHVRKVEIEPSDKLKAAVATRDLWLEEVKRAQKAVEEANEYINFLIDQDFIKQNLKMFEGELAYVQDYNLAFFYANGHLHQISTEILGGSHDRENNGL